MSSIGTGYDLSSSIYSPAGRVFQTEYAGKAVESSGTALALRGKDGVVFAVEYIVQSKLHEKAPHHRIFNVDKHIGMVCTGFLSDGRMVANKARDEACDYHQRYGVPIPCKVLNERVSAYMHGFTLLGYQRPLGASVLMGSYNEVDGPELYMAEPSGVSWGYYGSAVGKGAAAAHSEIEKLKLSEMTCRELVNEAAKIIYAVHDEVKDKHFNLFLSWVSAETLGKHTLVPEDVHNAAEAFAKAALEAADNDD